MTRRPWRPTRLDPLEGDQRSPQLEGGVESAVVRLRQGALAVGVDDRPGLLVKLIVVGGLGGGEHRQRRWPPLLARAVDPFLERAEAYSRGPELEAAHQYRARDQVVVGTLEPAHVLVSHDPEGMIGILDRHRGR